jgi:hypothetical protein
LCERAGLTTRKVLSTFNVRALSSPFLFVLIFSSSLLLPFSPITPFIFFFWTGSQRDTVFARPGW